MLTWYAPSDIQSEFEVTRNPTFDEFHDLVKKSLYDNKRIRLTVLYDHYGLFSEFASKFNTTYKPRLFQMKFITLTYKLELVWVEPLYNLEKYI